jgi:hypothetical protein
MISAIRDYPTASCTDVGPFNPVKCRKKHDHGTDESIRVKVDQHLSLRW